MAAAISAPVRCSPATPTVLPTYAFPALKMPYATRPMSSAATPAIFASPVHSVKYSTPSGPGFGPAPKWMRFSQ